MNIKNAAIFLRLHRPDHTGDQDSRIPKALRLAEKDAELGAALARQREVDLEVRSALRAIALPDDLRAKIAQLHTGSGGGFTWRGVWKQPAFFAVVIALGAIAFVGVRAWLDARADFPGREAVQRMLSINENLTSADFERVSTTAGNLGDWLILRGLDRYDVPEEFADFKVIGCRIYRPEGHRVAQVAVQNDASDQMLFYVFRADDFGVKLEGKRWRTVNEGDWAAALRGYGPTVFMVAVKGSERDAKKVVESAKGKK